MKTKGFMFYQINEYLIININKIITINKFNNEEYKIVMEETLFGYINENEYLSLVKYLVSKDLLTENEKML